MIEFKGECGHTIRARDEDVGKIVRCSYCGKEALVTRQPQDDLDVLFDAVEQTGADDAQATRVGQKFHRVKSRENKRLAAGKPAKAFDPFDIAMKMTYVALGIILVVFGFKYIPGLYEDLTGGAVQNPPSNPTETANANPVENSSPPQTGRGLLSERLSTKQEGVYVSSVPQGAGIYQLPQTSVSDSICSDPVANKNLRTNKALRLPPGKHTIALALRVNEPWLMALEGYTDLRKKIEADDPRRDEAVRNFFVPDGSIETRVERVRGALHLIRVFECEVDAQTWVSATALFLPRSLSQEQTVTQLPNQVMYKFQDTEAKRELTFYEVEENDKKFVTDALKRVGVVSYKRKDGSY